MVFANKIVFLNADFCSNAIHSLRKLTTIDDLMFENNIKPIHVIEAMETLLDDIREVEHILVKNKLPAKQAAETRKRLWSILKEASILVKRLNAKLKVRRK